MSTPRAYHEAAAVQRAELESLMLAESWDPWKIAFQRTALTLLEADLVDGRTPFRSPHEWVREAKNLTPGIMVPPWTEEQKALMQGYQNKVTELRRKADLIEVVSPPLQQVSYVYEPTAASEYVHNRIADVLVRWALQNPIALEQVNAELGLLRMLEDRPGLAAAYRLVQQRPYEITVVSHGNPDLEQQFLGVLIGMVPVVGDVTALGEAWVGFDLFGTPLSSEERGLRAITTLLPFVGRFVRAGRLLYSGTRLARLYGSEAVRWSETLAIVEVLSSHPGLQREIFELGLKRSAPGSIPSRTLAPVWKRTTHALRRATTSSPHGLPVDEAAVRRLVKEYPELEGLDAYALSRCLDKGLHHAHVKGQLLEEIAEEQILARLRTEHAPRALGLKQWAREPTFVPGHLVLDENGRQFSDGLLGIELKDGTFEVLAIFEAKAGQASARALRWSKDSLSKLSKGAREELRKYAREVWNELPAPDRALVSVEEIERSIKLAEYGGQIRLDFERFAEDADGNLPILRLAGTETRVRMSPARTKAFGVLPLDVQPGGMKEFLAELGYDFEVMSVPISSQRLGQAASAILAEASSGTSLLP